MTGLRKRTRTIRPQAMSGTHIGYRATRGRNPIDQANRDADAALRNMRAQTEDRIRRRSRRGR
jgi:hypothetical protein